MKTNRLLRFACLIIVLVMIVSAMPVSAETSSSNDTLLDTTIDFELGEELSTHLSGTVMNDDGSPHKGNISVFNTTNTAILTPYDFNLSTFGVFLKKDPVNSKNYALRVESSSSFFAIKDTNQKLVNGDFVISADVYFTMTNISGTLPVIQWIRDEKLAAVDNNLKNKNTLIKVEKGTGQIIANDKGTGAFVNDLTWYNIKVCVSHVSGSTYEVSTYLDNELIYVQNQDMSEPTEGASGSYIMFFSRTANCKFSYLDNVRIYETDSTPIPEFHSDIDFDELTSFSSTKWLTAENLAEFYNTDDVVVSTSSAKSFHTRVTADPVDANNIVAQNASGRSYFVVQDVNNKLIGENFAVSADMYFTMFAVEGFGLIQWLRGSDIGNSAVNTLISVDTDGILWCNGKSLNASISLNEWFNIAISARCVSGNKYQLVIYLDGKIIGTEEMTFSVHSSGDGSFIRVWNLDNTGFKAYLDNLYIGENDPCAIIEEKNVIWDVNFNNLENGTKLDTAVWSKVSSGYKVKRSTLGYYNHAVVEDGKLKVTPLSSATYADINIGGGNYDPMKQGPVAISMKLNVTVAETGATPTLVAWRRTNGILDVSAFKQVAVLVLDKSSLTFMGKTVVDEIEIGKEYDIKMILDGYKRLASIYIDGVKIIDSMSIAAYASGILGENLTYIKDDAGNKHELPYTGLVSCQEYDSDGNAISGAYVKRFVESAGYNVDSLRLFCGSSKSTSTMYVDDFKVERVDNGNVFFDTDFTGWSKITDQKPGNTNSGTYGYVYFSDNPTIKADENGNEYLNCEGVQRIFIGHRRQELLFNSFELSFDMYYTKLDSPKSTGIGSFVNAVGYKSLPNDSVNPYTKYNSYANPLKADEKGNLYDKDNTLVAKGVDGKWTNVRMVFIGNGTGYTGVEYHINGKHVHTGACDISSEFKDFIIRILPNNRFNLKLDNVKINYVNITQTLSLDFDGEYEDMLDILGTDYRYPAIDSTRTDANGNTVVSARVLGEDDKFLRIDRTLLAAAQDGFIRVENKKYIDGKEYIVETDFRFSCDAGFGITPVTISVNDGAKVFAPVQVKGAYNTLSVSIRGALYDLYSSSGTLLNVNTVNDDGFTKLAVLINENDLTYTVYVNRSIAYYYYDGEYLPCANLPITYVETGVSAGLTGLKLMEIDSIKQNYSVIDIDRIAVIPANSGIASDFRATQSKFDIANQLFDLRFIAGVDSLYGNLVGFVVETTYTDGVLKTAKKEFTSDIVYASIEDETGTVAASDLGSGYLFVMSVTALPITNNGVEFKVTPFVEHGGVRSYGDVETFVAKVVNDTVTVK